MSSISKIIAAFAIVISLAGCSPEDRATVKLRDYQTQYVTDNADIVEFLKTHSYTVINNPGAHDDQDVTFTVVPETDPTSIWNSGQLLQRPVTKNEVEYIIYYLELREGGGADAANLRLQPSNVDAVLAAYEGRYLARATVADAETGVEIGDLVHKVFETNPFPSTFFPLETVIRGWSEVFPQFRPGDRTSEVGQPNLYTDFGAGIMFIPSGLGYYNAAQGSIPAYAPLIFTFKLYDISRLDQDGDGVPSYLEDRNSDRYIYIDENGVAVEDDDTDGDGLSDYMDNDDDNDGTLTKTETRRPQVNSTDSFTYYPYFGAAIDDPTTPNIDETQGIPSCGGAFTGDRVRRHLDASCE